VDFFVKKLVEIFLFQQLLLYLTITKNNYMSNKNQFTQLCVWPGTVLEGEEGKISPQDFEAWMLENFGARIKYKCEVTTLPDVKNGRAVPDTGGRNDVFFYVHSDDIGGFAVARLQVGIRWWEDVIKYNDNSALYTEEFVNENPPTW
jgi:hypothetical protein